MINDCEEEDLKIEKFYIYIYIFHMVIIYVYGIY